MCFLFDKPDKVRPAPPPTKAPEIELGDEETVTDVKQRKRTGLQQLQTGLQIGARGQQAPVRASSGLQIPTA